MEEGGGGGEQEVNHPPPRPRSQVAGAAVPGVCQENSVNISGCAGTPGSVTGGLPSPHRLGSIPRRLRIVFPVPKDGI
jgi:hypothetical protein